MMNILNEIWEFISSNQTASAVTFLGFLFAVFVWIHSTYQNKKKQKETKKSE